MHQKNKRQYRKKDYSTYDFEDERYTRKKKYKQNYEDCEEEVWEEKRKPKRKRQGWND